MKKFTPIRKMWYFFNVATLFFILSAFFVADPLEEDSIFLENQLVAHYDGSFAAGQVNRYELSVTTSGFCRYKRYFKNGKIEYFAFNFLKYKDADFFGRPERGLLYLRTKADDVIVQTYKDRGGDVDSMASFMIIPLKQVEAEDLNNLAERFASLRSTLQKQQTRLSLRGVKPQ